MTFDLSKIKDRLTHVSKEFSGKVAQVGFPKGQEYEDGTPVAYVAAIQNNGSPLNGIPPRPFFEPTVQDKKADWVKLMGAGAKKVSQGQLSGFDVLDGVGRMAVADLQETISKITEPELSLVTVLLRKWRKEGRTITGKTVGEAAAAIKNGVDPGDDNKPLNDTGLMITSVRNAVGTNDQDFEV